MAKHLKITDAAQGVVSLAKNKRSYFKTKDSTSASGHSLMAQIEMTHSGIVTKNYGFYLPARMKVGAASFTKDYAKPLLVGHDEQAETKPVGRVVNAEYMDTSDVYKTQDKYLQSLFSFQDAKGNKDGMLDFVNHVIKEYDARDAYKGLGNLRGTLRIEDAETIEAVLDGRYLTVSTSMISDSATCNICGTDWVAEGLCEHSRGQVYDDNVCVVIPGSMSYDHLGIVNTPADPHAHDFKIISDNPSEPNIYQIGNSAEKTNLYPTRDRYTVAASLFAYNDSALVPLSAEEDINLIDVKNDIQKMENAMKLIPDRIKDAMDVKVEVYRFSNGDVGSKEVTVREYMEEIDEGALQTMITQIAKMIETEDSAKVSDDELKKVVDKYCADNFELATKPAAVPAKEEGQVDDSVKPEGFDGDITYDDQTVYKGAEASTASPKKRKKKKAKKMNDAFKLEAGEEITHEMITTEVEAITVVEGQTLDSESIVTLAELISLYKNEDAITVATFNWKDKAHADIIKEFSEWTDAQIEFNGVEAKDLYEEMKNHMAEDAALTEEALDALKTSVFAGGKGIFPVTDEAHAKAALAVLARCKVSDSIKGRILSSIYRKAKRLDLDLTDNFDSTAEPCNNTGTITNEDAVKAFEDAKAVLTEMGIEVPGEAPDTTDKDQEIQILESQLDAANEELDSLSDENADLRFKLAEQLATRTVDMKILSGNFEMKDRVEEITEHKARNVDSLLDAIKDLEAQVKVQDFVQNDGMANNPEGEIDDPTLGESKEANVKDSTSKELEEEKSKYKIYDNYNAMISRYGKKEADRWLKKVQNRNGNIPTID